MTIVEVTRLAFPEVAMIRFARFKDHRAGFTEQYRASEFPGLGLRRGIDFRQMNESFSKAGTIRGLHFRRDPYQAKPFRAVTGRPIELVMDIRKGSPASGPIIAQERPTRLDEDHPGCSGVPPGHRARHALA
jgi:dTDP-4-dehydrorhamnose 3,5-epimerase